MLLFREKGRINLPLFLGRLPVVKQVCSWSGQRSFHLAVAISEETQHQHPSFAHQQSLGAEADSHQSHIYWLGELGVEWH